MTMSWKNSLVPTKFVSYLGQIETENRQTVFDDFIGY